MVFTFQVLFSGWQVALTCNPEIIFFVYFVSQVIEKAGCQSSHSHSNFIKKEMWTQFFSKQVFKLSCIFFCCNTGILINFLRSFSNIKWKSSNNTFFFCSRLLPGPRSRAVGPAPCGYRYHRSNTWLIKYGDGTLVGHLHCMMQPKVQMPVRAP